LKKEKTAVSTNCAGLPHSKKLEERRSRAFGLNLSTVIKWEKIVDMYIHLDTTLQRDRQTDRQT